MKNEKIDENTKEVVAPKKATKTMKVKLFKPVEYEGKTYESLEFDFYGLKGKDMLKIDEEMEIMGAHAMAPQLSRDFQCRLAARAAGVPSGVMGELDIVDFSIITQRVQNFLLGLGF